VNHFTLHLPTSNLILEIKVANSKESPMSSSMKDSKEGLKCISSLVLDNMVMAKFKASNNNQCLANWFKMQVESTWLKKSTIV
jgi:hypothetical protein